jgi:hypothetical protein
MELENSGQALEVFRAELEKTGDHMERVMFPNGYGVSIIRHDYSYGGKAGLFEVGVLGKDGELTYKTPVTGDVLGWQSVDEVLAAMKQVADLSDEQPAIEGETIQGEIVE